MRNISVFTATRAEYGLLYNLIKLLDDSKDIKLNLFVGGTHLVSEFGMTKTQIQEDNLKITEEIDFFRGSKSPTYVLESFASALNGIGHALNNNSTDLLVLLGDRYEALAAAQAASILKIPIVHIHGGEITMGALDDCFRNAITKLSHLHFTSTDEYRDRIIQMGENPNTVFNVGSPGVENINKISPIPKKDLSSILGCNLDKYFVLTYHPETLSSGSISGSLENIFLALDNFVEYNLIITYPNSDHGGEEIIELINLYKQKNKNRVFAFKSLGQKNYLSLIKHCDGVIGNSSSGIIEAPSFGKPVLNIGDRQKGRIQSKLVINSSYEVDEIIKNIQLIIKTKFKNSIDTRNPYDGGNTSKKIFNILKKFPLDGILYKQFYDLK